MERDEQDALWKLASRPTSFDSLRGKLAGLAAPTLDLDHLGRIVSESTGLDIDEGRSIVTVLMSGYYQRVTDRVPAAEAATGIIASLVKGRPDNAHEQSLPGLEALLAELLSLDATIGVTAKAYDLMAERDSLFCRVRVLTDVRPIFQPEQGPKGDMRLEHSVVLHSLHLTYHEGPRHREIFVALRDHDIAALQEHLERAKRKSLEIRRRLDKELKPLEDAK